MERVEILRGEAPKDLGDGDGDGDGYGSGYGAGSGYGSGSGYGHGYGYGYWRAVLKQDPPHWSDEQRARLAAVRSEGATIAYWRSERDGRPANGGAGGPRKAGDVEKIAGPLKLCGGGALHATLDLDKWKGPKVWIVALFGEVVDQGDKLGALHREILGEAWTVPS